MTPIAVHHDSTIPHPNGTRIYETDGQGNRTGPPKFSLAWNSRLANRREGCLQWICYIAVGDTLEAARAGLDSGIIVDTGIASSSRMSRNVHAIYFDENGEPTRHRKFPHVLVPTLEPDPASPYPRAVDLWFSEEPFDPDLELPDGQTVRQVEFGCANPLTTE